jgi:protein phosphatase
VGRQRKQNEDSFLVDDELGLYVVSDGMGGHAAGDIASQAAVAFVAERMAAERALIEGLRSGERSVQELRELVEDVALGANRHVYELAQSGKGRPGMGATLIILVVAGHTATIAHVGDSRLYLVRGEGISQLTLDHTISAEMLRSGLISEDELEDSPFKHVLARACGTRPEVEFDLLTLEVLPGDRFLLCSDGYSNYLEHPGELAPRVAHEEPEGLAQQLVEEANAAGGSDNITVVIVSVEGEDPESLRAAMLAENYEALRSVFLFEELDLPLLTRVMAACDVEVHESGHVAVTQDETCDALCIVVDGRYVLERGGEEVGHVSAGGHVGATALIEPRPARATLRATEASRLLRLRRESFRRLIRERRWLGIGLLRQMGRMLSVAVDRTWAQRAGARVPVPDEERL